MDSIMSELPEELVIIVLRKLSSTDQTRAGLVCRRWHTIIVPYLWREIEVSGRRTPLHLRDPKNLLSLLTSGAISPMSPTLHIQRLKLRAIRLDILDIFQLLKSLPRLRRFDIEWIVLHARDDTVLQPWQDSHRFQLERVHITWNLASGNGGRGLVELQLLDLFSEIRQLSLDYSAYGQTRDIDESDPRALKSLVSPHCYSDHELVLNLGSVIPPQLNLLFQRNAFRDLTCLSVRITNVNALQNMNTLLCLAGGTLVELFLELRWDLSLQDQFDPILHENSVVRECSLRREFAREALRSGVAKCTNLDASRIQMSTISPMYDYYEPSALLEMVVQGWLMAVDIASLVYPDDSNASLQRLSLQYWSNVLDSRFLKYFDFAMFSWDTLRSVCRRYRCLQSLSVEFTHEPNTDLRWSKEVYEELQEFKALITR